MANIHSAIKKIRQDAKRTALNKARKVTYKASIKELSKKVAAGTKGVEAQVAIAYKHIDKAAKNNTIHKNKAARLKSKVALMVNSAK